MKKNTLINSIQIAILMMTGVQAHALPINGTFQNGTGAISPPDGNTLTIDQTSNSAVINWDSFNISQGSTVTFNTPDAAAATLNIINGNAPSDIKGSLTSNGQLFLFNKNGFLFGATSSVNAAGFMALSSGTNVAYDDGNRTLTLSGNGGGNITTEEGATINAADSGGYIALIAPGINNAATLTANAGSILLTTNNTGTLIVPALSNAIGFNLSELSGTSSNRLTNSGHITAHNGFVTLSSDALDIITGSAINNSGIIDISLQPGNTSGGVVEINASQGTLIQNGNILATGGDISLQSDNIRITSPVELIADKVLFKKSTAASGGTLNLRADAHITADRTIDLSEFSIIGAGDGVSLTLETNANESTIQLNTIQNVGELTATAEGTLILAGDIQAAGNNLTLNAGTIRLDSDILIRNTLPGNLILTGPITGQNTSLTLQNLQGKVSVDGINGVTNLTILNNLGTTEVNGNLSLTGTFNAVQSGSLTLNGNREITANSILLDGITTQSNGTLNLTASTSGNISSGNISSGNISIGQITASEFSASGDTLILNGGITTGIGNKLDLSGMKSIELTGNSVLTGNLTLNTADHATGIYNTKGTTAYQLSIISGSDLHLGEIGTAEHPLSSVRIQGNGNLTFASANGNIPIYTRGNDGIALLGNMNFIVNDDLTLNTASYNGDLNLSGINIDGTGTLTLNSGDGDISLGNIGLNGAFAGLTIESASTLNLHGLLNLTETTLDFSNVNSIILHSNQTWGTATTPYSVNLGNSSIDGTYNLNINASALTMNGTIGANQALQNLSIDLSSAELKLASDITLAGNLSIKANLFTQNANIYSTGGNISILSNTGIQMSADSSTRAQNGNVQLTSTTGDIGIGIINAFRSIRLTATQGSLINAINDYIADNNTSINLQAPDVQLQAGVNIGTSVASPVVIAAGRQGTIHAQAPGDVYIANIDGSQTNLSGRSQDISLQTRLTATDAIQQLNIPTYIQQPEPTENELNDPLWNSDSQDARTYGAPRIYQDRRGIRLGNP